MKKDFLDFAVYALFCTVCMSLFLVTLNIGITKDLCSRIETFSIQEQTEMQLTAKDCQ